MPVEGASTVSEQTAVELARINRAGDIWESAINSTAVVLSIASFGIPLYCVYLTVNALSNQNTQVSPHVAYLVSAMVGGTSGIAVLVGGLAKFAGQRKELIRQRERIAKLEERIDRLKKRGNRR
jgi:hypothetical protein